MAVRRYQNFDLALEAVGDGSLRARVVQCPVGEYSSVGFSLPLEGSQLELLMLKLDPGRSGTRRAGADSQQQAGLDLGGVLFESVFRDDVMLAWSRSRDVTRAAGEGLRLRLRFTDAPQVGGLPWKLLYDRRTNSYVAQSDRTPLVRYLEVPYPPRPLSVGGALRVLVVLSSPTDLPELDVEAEWRRVEEAMAAKAGSGRVVVERLPAPTMAELSAWLEHHDDHILHFVGHGDYDDRTQSGVVYFCDRYGRSVAVGPDVLGPFLHDHDPLRLVLLNACQSARVDAKDPFGGMAQGRCRDRRQRRIPLLPRRRCGRPRMRMPAWSGLDRRSVSHLEVGVRSRLRAQVTAWSRGSASSSARRRPGRCCRKSKALAGQSCLSRRP